MNVTDVALRVPSSRETRSAAGRHLVTPGGRFAAGRDSGASVLPVSQPVKQSSSRQSSLLCCVWVVSVRVLVIKPQLILPGCSDYCLFFFKGFYYLVSSSNELFLQVRGSTASTAPTLRARRWGMASPLTPALKNTSGSTPYLETSRWLKNWTER